MNRIVLTSPLRGWVTSLEEVADPVFAGRMLGDGVAIEPTGSVLHAPCDAHVIAIHASGHAVTLRTVEGVELLMHLGIDTVGLGGLGFATRVSMGDQVRRGDPLIDFDLDALLPQVPAMTTPILVSNTDRFEVIHRDTDRAVAVGERLMTIAPRAAVTPIEVVGEERSREVVIPLVHGIHARPAGRLAERAREFRAQIVVQKGTKIANARSAISLLSLGAKFEDTVNVIATGDDADEALTAICSMIGSGMGERGTPKPVGTAAVNASQGVQDQSPVASVGLIPGVLASPGIAVGGIRWLREDDAVVPEDGNGAGTERARLETALTTVAQKGTAASKDAQAVLEAHRSLLGDPELRGAAYAAIDQGRSAERAWRGALRASADILRGLGDARLAERADDLLDVERQVLAVLLGRAGGELSFPPNTILLAEDLLPSQLISIGANGIAGFCTVRGGPTSHVAILAAGMGIPGLVAAGTMLASAPEDAHAILDAQAGTLRIDPDAEELRVARASIDAAGRRRAATAKSALLPAVTKDGEAIEIFANLASVADARRAVESGAEGCGLLRTEFLFLERQQPPSETEQAGQYQAIAAALGGRPLIIRLLDIGGDKPAPYLPIPAEENPALGLRGIRVGLAHRDMLDAQLRAILKVEPIGQCRIMVPMVASVSELLMVRQALDNARFALGIAEPVALGVMVETPAAAVTADLLAAHADFLSIGTNDLTQYVLAMDRGNPAVAAGIDAMHPAVLRMIGQTCEGGLRQGRWTGMCGGLASDAIATPILIGLGVKELSVTTSAIAEIKAAVRSVAAESCRALAREALTRQSAAEVRDLARRFSEECAR